MIYTTFLALISVVFGASVPFVEKTDNNGMITRYYSTHPEAMSTMISGNSKNFPKNTCSPRHYTPGTTVDRYVFGEGPYLGGFQLQFENCLNQGVGIFGSATYRTGIVNAILFEFDNQRITTSVALKGNTTVTEMELCLSNGRNEMGEICVRIRFIKVEMGSYLAPFNESPVPQHVQKLFSVGSNEVLKAINFDGPSNPWWFKDESLNADSPYPKNTCALANYNPYKPVDIFYSEEDLPSVVLRFENCQNQAPSSVGYIPFVKMPNMARLNLDPPLMQGPTLDIPLIVDFPEWIGEDDREIQFLIVNGVLGHGTQDEMEASAITIRFHKMPTSGKKE